MRNTVDPSRAVAVAGRAVSASSADSPSKRTRSGDDVALAAPLRLEIERAPLHDVGAVRRLAGREQHLIRLDVVAFGADGEDTQRRCAELAENWNPLKERDVVLDRHDGRNLRHELVAAGLGDQDGGGGGVLLDFLP